MDRQINEYFYVTLMKKMRGLPSKKILNLVERKEDMDHDRQQRNVTISKESQNTKGMYYRDERWVRGNGLDIRKSYKKECVLLI